MSAMRGLMALALVAVAAATFLFLSGDDSTDPVAAGRSDQTEPVAGADETAIAPPVSTIDDPAPTRTVAEAETAAAATGPAAAADTRPTATVSGRVVDEGGRPVPGASVRLAPEGMMFALDDLDDTDTHAVLGRRETTDAGGRFKFGGVRDPAKYQVRVRSTDVVDIAQDIPAPPDAEGDIDLGDLIAVLGATVTGHVVDDGGNPVAGAEVRAWARKEKSNVGGMIMLGDFGGMNAKSALTDGSGFFRIGGLASGEGTVVAEAKGFTRGTVQGLALTKGRITSDVRVAVEPGTSISGIVSDATGRPVPDAIVSVSETVINLSESGMSGAFSQDRTERTGPDGRFELSGLKEASYNVTATKTGWLTQVASDVEAGTQDVRIAIRPSGLLWGLVTDSSSDRPVPDFEASTSSDRGMHFGGSFVMGSQAAVLRGDAAAAAAGVTADPALFAITGFSTDEVSLNVVAEGFTRFSRSGIEVPSGQSIRVDVELVPERTIRGIVLDTKGIPVANAIVSVTKPAPVNAMQDGMRISRRIAVRDTGGGPEVVHGDVDRRATTEMDGTFVLDKMAEGEWSLVASHQEWAPSEALTVSLGDESIEGLQLVMRAGGRLVGIAYDADGLPLADASVRLNQPAPPSGAMSITAGGPDLPGSGLDGSNLHAVTDQDGSYEITGILPGRYDAKLDRPRKAGGFGGAMVMFAGMGGGDSGTPVSIEEGETSSLDLRLAPTGTLRGLITEAGNPIPNVPISLAKSDSPFPFGGPSTRTDENGRYELLDVEPAAYTMSVKPSGARGPIERKVDVDARRVTEEDVNLPTGVIAGRVTDADSGDGIPDVIIEISPADQAEESEPQPQRRAAFVSIRSDSGGGGGVQSFSFGNENELVVTDSDGNYEVRYLDPVDYRVEVRGGGIEPQVNDRVSVIAGARKENVNFEAIRGATLVVRPRASDDTPLHFIRATLTNDATGDSDQQMEIGSPTITFEGLKPGSYSLKVTAGDASGERQFAISSGEEKEIPIDLE